ncbi:hypothetical protein SAMN02745163_03956 [Clostridium cavendishii DSM 21758]|uniref:Uncharacterized protein n=1 Tax=Clostridium cavendishii DSM 21758 TaxID=1121302 RepID=A0A1M6T5U9_9CLOT|nr:hypothetical protein [Clostridium cavendishii]SHK52256.1 hypothetical protein SAMN02745163_03956 [Clostridium cavendishii DSM 21758]
MRKFTFSFLIFLCLSFNILNITAMAAGNTFKEGVYKVSDFNFSSNNIYNIQNVSSTDTVFVLIFDENNLQLQTIRLGPLSLKYNLLPLKPTYRLVIVGNGNIFIS